jgi:hypothetical protein
VVDLLGGEPEYLDPLKDEAPARINATSSSSPSRRECHPRLRIWSGRCRTRR